MNFTVELSKNYNVTPFEILRQEKDEVIMLINYYIERGNVEQPTPKQTSVAKGGRTGERVRVNDKTATGGWF